MKILALMFLVACAVDPVTDSVEQDLCATDPDTCPGSFPVTLSAAKLTTQREWRTAAGSTATPLASCSRAQGYIVCHAGEHSSGWWINTTCIFCENGTCATCQSSQCYDTICAPL